MANKGEVGMNDDIVLLVEEALKEGPTGKRWLRAVNAAKLCFLKASVIAVAGRETQLCIGPLSKLIESCHFQWAKSIKGRIRLGEGMDTSALHLEIDFEGKKSMRLEVTFDESGLAVNGGLVSR